MKLIVAISFLLFSLSLIAQEIGKAEQLSIDFFEAVKNSQTEKSDNLAKKLANYDRDSLLSELYNDDKILSFWINIYNTNVQYILNKDASKFENRGAFFKAKQITIASKVLSFDSIEHGILRKSKSKLSLGYIRKIVVSKFERQFRIKRVDPRIHYALNCGALSCPPIMAYHSERIDAELNKSVIDYLTKYCVVRENVIEVPVFFSWFRADFGGKSGIRKFLLCYGITDKNDKKKELKFLPYDWTLALNLYK
jgi:hypothetical protein